MNQAQVKLSLSLLNDRALKQILLDNYGVNVKSHLGRRMIPIMQLERADLFERSFKVVWQGILSGKPFHPEPLLKATLPTKEGCFYTGKVTFNSICEGKEVTKKIGLFAKCNGELNQLLSRIVDGLIFNVDTYPALMATYEQKYDEINRLKKEQDEEDKAERDEHRHDKAMADLEAMQRSYENWMDKVLVAAHEYSSLRSPFKTNQRKFYNHLVSISIKA